MATKKLIQKQKFDPFENLILDDYEKEIEASIARGEWKPVDNQEEVRKMFQEAAKGHIELKKSKRITVRVNQGDLIRLKAKAQENRIPYQTLLGSLIRNYVEGRMKVQL